LVVYSRIPVAAGSRARRRARAASGPPRRAQQPLVIAFPSILRGQFLVIFQVRNSEQFYLLSSSCRSSRIHPNMDQTISLMLSSLMLSSLIFSSLMLLFFSIRLSLVRLSLLEPRLFLGWGFLDKTADVSDEYMRPRNAPAPCVRIAVASPIG
jgi:hypothetical protein